MIDDKPIRVKESAEWCRKSVDQCWKLKKDQISSEEIDEANGRVTVMINIFGRSTPVELEHWQIEDV